MRTASKTTHNHSRAAVDRTRLAIALIVADMVIVLTGRLQAEAVAVILIRILIVPRAERWPREAVDVLL